ncbi:MAG: 50S ribosomal protein L16 [Candidatus Bathyarchaeia archaeon]
MKARNFKEIKGMPYTRRTFMGGVPGSKITKFTMGDSSRDYPYSVELVNLENAQIRHNALESARIAANRLLELKLAKEGYCMKVIPYPHMVLREHKRVNVAQADRFQEGMKKAYGKPVGTAARVMRGETIIRAEVTENGIEVAKEALKRAAAKFPVKSRIIVRENN